VKEMGGMAGFRAFAAQIAQALQARDADFFMERTLTSSVTCPNEFVPQCAGQPAGSSVEGIPFGRWHSEGTLLPVDGFQADLVAYLNALGDPTLHAIGTLAQGILAEGSAFFAVVLSSNEPSTTRIFEFVLRDGGWRMPAVIEAPILAHEWLSGECLECYDHWERWRGGPAFGY